MSKLIIVILLILNIIVLYQNGDSISLIFMTMVIPGAYKGLTVSRLRDIFNFYKVKYSLKAPQRKLELFCSFLAVLSTEINLYKELFHLGIFPSGLEILSILGFVILFTFLMYRFLFLNMFKNEEKA